MMDVYEDLPLVPASKIRLLRFKPPPYYANTDGVLNIELKNFEFSVITNGYVALSYKADRENPNCSIRVNGMLRYIPERLSYFFHSPRFVENTLYWVDIICLNQNDDSERAEQILRIREIYENAKHVHAELGPGDKKLQNALINMQRIGKMDLSKLDDSGLEYPSLVEAGYPEDWVEPFFNDSVWVDIDKVFQNPWWDRGWTLLEATVNPNTNITLGNVTIPLKDALVTNVAFKFLVGRQYLDHKEPRPAGIQRISRMNTIRSSSGTKPLLEVLQTFREANFTNHREVFFAALGFANDVNLRPHYKKQFRYLSRDVVEYYLSQNPPLVIFGYCGDRPLGGGNGPSGIPSWIPQWGYAKQVHTPLPTIYKTTGESIYNVAGKYSFTNFRTHWFQNLKLFVRGFAIDEIDIVSVPPQTNDNA